MRTESDGVFAGTFQPETTGAFDAQVWVSRGGKRYGQDRLRFNVLESHFEEEDLRPDTSLLRELAQSSGGKYIPADDFSMRAFDQFDDELKRKAGRKVLLWNSPWFFLIIALLLISEWVLRKRRGLS
jgi:hypothetical protein